MDSPSTYWADRAALEWLAELGADEAILEAPVDRYRAAEEAPKPAAPAAAPAIPSRGDAPPPPPPLAAEVDAVAEARALAAGAPDLPGLAAAMQAFDHCALKQGARRFVFAKGDPAAPLLLVLDPPEREADRAGDLAAGAEGRLLANMLAAIGRALSPDAGSAYALPALPWRTLSDGPAAEEDLAVMRPFLHRHIALAAPEVVVLMGQNAVRAALGEGAALSRGNWGEVLGRPALAMRSPRHLLRAPSEKREAWADLLEVRARLAG